jgi:SAM-dependent methyltransferase
MTLDERGHRETDFWGHHIPDLVSCLAEVEARPDPNTEAMLRAVEPVAGARILDFACGGGVTSAWLAARGAEVVGVDLSPESLDRAREVHAALGLEATFVPSLDDAAAERPFDAIVGRYALHHTDVPALAPVLAAKVRSGGKGAFVETFATNPLLRVARGGLTGRLGIPKLGTDDEQPLARRDLAALQSAFGHLDVACAQMHFLRLFDRQVLRYRSRRFSSILSQIDDAMGRLPASASFSYFQVVIVKKTSLLGR